MGHGKETPRQKMIGMMYLVLTAMLAMNVSVEVLDAFVLVDEGLVKTTKNYKVKNKKTYSEFNFFYEQNKAKVGPWKAKADSVKSLTLDLFEYIHECKLAVLEGEDEALHDGEIHGEKVAGKSDTDAGARVMVGIEPGTGKGEVLKEKIVHYREVLESLIQNPEKDSSLVSAIHKLLDTHEPEPTPDGIHHSWVSEHFAHIPLIAVLPMLTKIQVDILNAEAEILNYLLNQINEGGFNFNYLEATVIQNSNYIIQGTEYQSQVFIAAFDTTQEPEVLVGRYDSIEVAPGIYDYEMKGDYQEMDVVGGKGVIKRKEMALGTQRWGGLIRIKKDDGTYLTRPFKAVYEVARANVVVSPTKMNVFYRGVENPVQLSVPGVDPTKVTASVTSGRIWKDQTGFIVKPAAGQNCDVQVFAEIDGQRKAMGSSRFRIKDVPDPFPRVINLPKSDEKQLTLPKLNLCPGLEAAMPEDFDFDLKFTIKRFKVTVTQGGYDKFEISNGPGFTQRQKDLFNSLRAKSRITIEDIEAVGPDGRTRNLNDINLKLK